MNSDEEIKRIAEEYIPHRLTNHGLILADATPEELVLLARATYNLGRQHQRESDAALCREHARNLKEASSEWMNTQRENLLVAESCGAKWCSEAIRNNTGELR